MQIKVSGLKEAEAQLLKLGSKDGTRVLRAAMLKATKPIEDQAKANVRAVTNGSGALALSIGRRFVVGAQKSFSSFLPDMGGRFTIVIGPLATNRVAVALHNLFYGRKRRGIFYGHLIEFGHRIAAGGRLKRSRSAVTKSVAKGDFSGLSAGSVPARPFLKPALDTKWQPAVAVLASEIGKGVDRLMKRRAK